MAEGGLDARDLLEGLLSLASETELEVRVISSQAAAAENAPSESAACRVGSRIWVVLNADDPPEYQAEVLAGTLGRYRSEYLEAHFVAPALREFIASI